MAMEALACMRRGGPCRPTSWLWKGEWGVSGSTWMGWECFSTAEGNNRGSKTWKHVYREGKKDWEHRDTINQPFWLIFTGNMGGTYWVLFTAFCFLCILQLQNSKMHKNCLEWVHVRIVYTRNEASNHFTEFYKMFSEQVKAPII